MVKLGLEIFTFVREVLSSCQTHLDTKVVSMPYCATILHLHDQLSLLLQVGEKDSLQHRLEQRIQQLQEVKF